MIPLLIVITGVLCGLVPTIFLFKELKQKQEYRNKLDYYKNEHWFADREKVAWRVFMKRLTKHTSITKNCKECGRFFKLTQADLLGRDIPEYCLEHKSMDIMRKHQSEGMRMQRDMLQQNLQDGQRRKLTGR